MISGAGIACRKYRKTGTLTKNEFKFKVSIKTQKLR